MLRSTDVGTNCVHQRLNCVARHHAVLDGEQRHQQQVDDQRFGERRAVPLSMVFGTDEAGDEADGVEKGDEEHEIGDDAVEECDKRP